VKNRVAEQWRDMERVWGTANLESLRGRGDRGQVKCQGQRGDTGLVVIIQGPRGREKVKGEYDRSSAQNWI
jgi:hypothetical protein